MDIGDTEDGVPRADRARASAAESETLTLYVADLMHRGRAAATCARRLAAIVVCRRAAGFLPSSPTEHEVVRSVCRGAPKTRVGVAQHPKTALVDDDPAPDEAPIDLACRIGLRDRALLARGFAGAFRRGVRHA